MAGAKTHPLKRPGTGRDLYLAMVGDRINDTMRFLDTLVMLCMDSWETLPPRGKHLIWLRLASEEPNTLSEMGLPLDEHGSLLHWAMWPNDLGDFSQAQALRLARAEQRELEPRNIAMQSALSQAAAAERTARLQVELAKTLAQLIAMGADPAAITELMRTPNSPSIRPIVDSMHEQLARAGAEPWSEPEGEPGGQGDLMAELEAAIAADEQGELGEDPGFTAERVARLEAANAADERAALRRRRIDEIARGQRPKPQDAQLGDPGDESE